MDMKLTGRVALVAASSRGLGKAVAEGLAREGAHLALCARNAEPLNQLAEELRKTHRVGVFAEAVDLTDGDGVRRFLDHVLDHYGKVDILVANAGGPPAGKFDDFEEPDWEVAFRLNFLTAMRLTKLVLPSMRRQRWGRLLYITSITVKQPSDNLILSNAVRMAVVGLAKSLSAELARDNILVNCVCPGFTRTERLVDLARTAASKEGIQPEGIFQRWESNIPLRRLAEPEEFANLVVFLASERASYITGTAIPVDGGFIKASL